MMEKMKLLFQNALMISAGILTAMSLEMVIYHVLGENLVLQWYHPMSILVAGFLCALPSLIWVDHIKDSRGVFFLRLALHFISLYILVMAMGYIFVWYRNITGYLFVSGSFILVYAFVWIATIWLTKKDEKKINEALKEIQDEE